MWNNLRAKQLKKISDLSFVIAYVLSVSFAALLISIQKELYIDITNCPTETIQAEVGEFYEVKFDLQAGTSEVTYIFFYFELNGEYYSRLPLDVESHSDIFYFPKSGELISSATFVEKLNDGDRYFVSIDVLDKNLNSSFSECEIEFNG